MLRNRAVAFLLCCLASRLAFALGLGPLEATSALNEPFKGRIEVLGAKAEDFDTLNIALAGEEQFRRAGIERAAVLFQLRFAVADSTDGKDYIAVTSRDSIREPFLNFLLEMNWANGRLLREYTVLLDPPLYDPNRRLAAAPAAPRPTPTARPSYVAPVTPAAAKAVPITAPSPAAAAATPPNGDIGPVGAGDTLWSLARSYRPDETISVQQMMLAILRQNPDAFSKGNVNMLRRGAVLHLPDDAQMRSISAPQAAAEIRHQHQLWEEYRHHASAAPVAQPLGTPATAPAVATEAAPAATVTDPNARLELVAPGGSAMGAASGKPGKRGATGAANTDDKLVHEETVDTTTRQAGDLKDRLTEAEEIINILQRQVNIKDQELASLQARLAELGVKQGDLGAPVADAAASATGAQPAESPATAATETTEPATETSTSVDPAPPAGGEPRSPAVAATTPAADVETPAAAPEIDIHTDKSSTPTASAPAPVEPSQEQEIDVDETASRAAPGFPASLVPAGIAAMVPGGALGVIGLVVLVILGIGGLIARTALKSNREAAEPIVIPLRSASPSVDSEDLTTATPLVSVGDDDRIQTLTNFDPLATETSLPAFDPNATVDAAEGPAPTGAADSDPLEEVNVYLAYERFDQAEELVKRVIAQYPARHDYKLRLLEVYYSSNDRVSYESAARELHSAVGESDPLWESALAMWAEMSPDRALFAAGGALAASLAPASASAFVDITGDSDTEATEATLTHAPRVGENTLDFDLVGESTDTGGDTSHILDLTAEEGGPSGEMLDLTTAEQAATGDMGSVFDLTANSDDPSLDLDANGVFDLTAGTGESNELLDITGGGEGTASSDDFLDLSGGGSDLLDVSKTGDTSMVDDLDLLNVTASGLASNAPGVELEPAADIASAASSATTASFDISDTVAPVFNPPDADDDDILDITGGNLAGAANDELEFDIGGLDIEDHPTVEMELPAVVKATGLDLDLTAGGSPSSALDFDIAASDDELSGVFDISESEDDDGDLEITMGAHQPLAGELSLKGEELDALALDSDDDVLLEGDLDFELDDTTELDAIAGDETLDMATAVASRPVRAPGYDDDATSLDDLTIELDGALGGGGNGAHLETLALDTLEIERDDLPDLGASQTIVMPVDHTIERQSSADEADTKLNLAKAYIELGDAEGARSILQEVAVEGTPAQQTEAKTLLGQLKA